MDVVKQMTRFLGPRGGARQDVPVAADADSSVAGGEDKDAWALYTDVEGRSDRGRREKKGSQMGKDKVKGDGRRLDGFNRITGFRNR